MIEPITYNYYDMGGNQFENIHVGGFYMLSIFNHVIGPVIRGPSSSHTGASYFIGRVARSLLMDEPKEVIFTFDEDGSYGRVYRQQG
ncbi:MAG: hypothetical protein J7J65_05955, partial [Candidatus Korarchaeota archaeon]|nr:hypothetical protein [Candidatus Korarchaeota archaeon]